MITITGATDEQIAAIRHAIELSEAPALQGLDLVVPTPEPDRLANARSSALASYANIAEMVERLGLAQDHEGDDYADLRQKLATEAGYTVAELDGTFTWRKDGTEGDDSTYDTAEEAWLAACEDGDLFPDEDEVRREIDETPLSVQVRSGWYSPGETPEAEEYEILLGTGGPAVRIVGDLGSGNEPSSARLQCQDWFTPWSEVFPEGGSDALLAFASCFFFGE